MNFWENRFNILYKFKKFSLNFLDSLEGKFMKSQTSQVARSCRICEWVAMIQECRNRPSGMSVDEWCQENNITKVNYYYRFVQVRKSFLDSIPTPVCFQPAKEFRKCLICQISETYIICDYAFYF